MIFSYWQPCAFNMVVSKQHKMIFFIFSQVNKEERLFVVVQDLQALLKKVKLWVQGKRTTLKFFKQLDGRPWNNYLQATLILESCIKRKNIKDLKSSKMPKGRKWNTYTNWLPHIFGIYFLQLWKYLHCNLSSMLHYLKTFHRKLEKLNGLDIINWLNDLSIIGSP